MNIIQLKWSLKCRAKTLVVGPWKESGGFLGMYGEAVGQFGWLCTLQLFVGGQLQAVRINKGEIMMVIPGKLLLVFCLLTVGGGVVANAQVDSVTQIEADVPFAFVVGDTTLPAGKYQIRRIDDVANEVLEIRSDNGRTAVVFDTVQAQLEGDRIQRKTVLVFDKVDDLHFLTQVWVAGSTTGNELTKSRMEKRLTKDGSQLEQMSVAAVMKRMKPQR